MDEQEVIFSNETRQRIKSEEIFREGIRKQILSESSPGTFLGRIWASRNSTFTIWLLSTVVVSLISLAYARQQAKQELGDQALNYLKSSTSTFENTLLEYSEAINSSNQTVTQLYSEAIEIQRRAYISQYLTSKASTLLTASPLQALEWYTVGGGSDFAGKNFDLWLDIAKGTNIEQKRRWFIKTADSYETKFRMEPAKRGLITHKFIESLRTQANRDIDELTYIDVSIELRKQAKTFDSQLMLFQEHVKNSAGYYFMIREAEGSDDIKEFVENGENKIKNSWSTLFENINFSGLENLLGNFQIHYTVANNQIRMLHEKLLFARLTHLFESSNSDNYLKQITGIPQSAKQTVIYGLAAIEEESSRKVWDDLKTSSTIEDPLINLFDLLVAQIKTIIEIHKLIINNSKNYIAGKFNQQDYNLENLLRRFRNKIQLVKKTSSTLQAAGFFHVYNIDLHSRIEKAEGMFLPVIASFEVTPKK